MKLWGSRMKAAVDSSLEELNASLPIDIRLFNEDIDGSVAWTHGLVRAGILSVEEAGQLEECLEKVRLEFVEGSFLASPSDEDIHTAVERRLTDLCGELGGRLHTGRSRNDQVATDFRLWIMRGCDALDRKLKDLQRAVLASAETALHAPMPGYTHQQRAQPITWGHWVLSYFWPLQRDRERLKRTRESAGVLPLGSGALAGVAFEVDRQALADELGFQDVSANSIDGVKDRDFAVEFLLASALIGVHMSQLAEQLITFATSEFGFVEINDRYATGSSLMPQKRNPDSLELARGKTGRLIGGLVGLLSTLKGLPSAYDKDLQEDKQPVIEAFDILNLLLPVMTGVISTLSLRTDRMLEALSPEMFATDLADYLVRKGTPFRKAHDLTGKAVRRAEELGVPLHALGDAELRRISQDFEDDVGQVFDARTALSRRASPGGTAPEALERQLELAKTHLD
ncbi:MAG TPA: argininosuccinate lyase [Anaerolineales bacterium]|nr:argininosuccinate lyase [Anaerolineales bacterium]